MEVGKGTRLLAVGGEVLLEPPPLGRAGTAADLSLSTVAVEGDYVPGSQVVGVVALIGVSGRLPEAVEVASSPFGFVVVVSGGGPGAVLEQSPGRIVALVEVFGRPVRVGVVAEGEHRVLDALDQLGGCIVKLVVAAGDVARRDDHRSVGYLRGGVFSRPHPAAIKIAAVVMMTTAAILLL